MNIARCTASCVPVLLAGCAAISTADGDRLALQSEEFRAYVERVFREQNRVADELAFALEAPAPARGELAVAEQRLLEACAAVNELATARRDELRLGLRRSLSAARTVPRCEQATRSAAEALAGDRAQ
jgi:outer membrane murein-binding lipoprotein Lpp